MRNIFFDRYGDLRVIWIVVLIMVLVLGVPIGAAVSIESGKCNNLESIDQIHVYNWSVLSGCRVQTQSGFFVDVDSPSVYEVIHETPDDQ